MRLAWLPFLFALTVTAGAAPVRNLAPGDINAAALNGAKNSEAVNIKAQVLLDRARFSPGTIDASAARISPMRCARSRTAMA